MFLSVRTCRVWHHMRQKREWWRDRLNCQKKVFPLSVESSPGYSPVPTGMYKLSEHKCLHNTEGWSVWFSLIYSWRLLKTIKKLFLSLGVICDALLPFPEWVVWIFKKQSSRCWWEWSKSDGASGPLALEWTTLVAYGKSDACQATAGKSSDWQQTLHGYFPAPGLSKHAGGFRLLYTYNKGKTSPPWNLIKIKVKFCPWYAASPCAKRSSSCEVYEGPGGQQVWPESSG